MLRQLDSLSADLVASASHKDPVVDQLLTLKQLAWLLRNAGGDATVLVASSVNGRAPMGEDRKRYDRLLGSIEMAWSSIEGLVSKTQIPANLTEAIVATKAAYFDPSYLALRDRLFEAPAKGQAPEMNAPQWVNFGVGRMGSAVNLAERALEAAQQHAADQKASITWSLGVQLVVLACAMLLALGAIFGVRRHVIRPLKRIRDAMIELARGNLSIEPPFVDRKDEIGALAGALSTFKANAIEKARIEEDQRKEGSRAMDRQRSMEHHIVAFEEQMSRALASLGTASEQMRETSSDMSTISIETNAQVRSSEKASSEASLSVQSVASASEELSATIAGIGRQAVQAADCAARAVEQAGRTDRTVKGLAESASRIGQVVELITSIAGQTNLLALNATIEAARAGESGRGFAVVASEVKSLATQTAKATEDISEQITAVQKVAEEAIEAINAIGGTIGQVSQVAAAIAAAVEEQGAATREISANTQLAAEGTRKVSEGIAGVTAGADAAGAAAQNVTTAAQILDAESKELRSQINMFLDQIRAA